MIGKTIDQLKVGEYATFAKTVTECDIYCYAGLTGDLNPAHINQQYAQDTFFKERIAHGMLSAGFISAILGTRLPGPGTVYLKQDLKFLAPVKINDTVTAKVEVAELILEKNRVILKTTCENQEGTVVLEGNATVSPPVAK